MMMPNCVTPINIKDNIGDRNTWNYSFIIPKGRTAELEEAYRSLLENERRFSEAQKVAHIGNWDWNIITNKLYLSNEVSRIYGCEPQKFSVTRNNFLSYVHPDDRDYVDNSFNRALNEKPINIDYRIILEPVLKLNLIQQLG